jgi:hypothetical protein
MIRDDALAGHVQFFVYGFFAAQGEKTIHNKSKVPCCRNPERVEGQAQAL